MKWKLELPSESTCLMVAWQGTAGSAAAKHNTAAACSRLSRLQSICNYIKQQKTQEKYIKGAAKLFPELQMSCFTILWLITLWKFVAENDTENHSYSEIQYCKRKCCTENFQCYLSVIFSVAFVRHNEDDSRIGFSHNNSEPNRIIIGLNFQCDYNRFDVVNEWLKIWNGI